MTNKADDLTGRKYGRLKVISRAENRSGKPAWNCICDCGNKTITPSVRMKNGSTRSCGCLQKEQAAMRVTTHGMSNSSELHIWRGIMQRCNNLNHKQYSDYGGRGITVCKRWEKFENFYNDMGNKPKGLSIDRIDNDKGYSPENCRWANNSQQNFNKRMPKNNTSGMKGVGITSSGKYQVVIKVNKVFHNLGLYDKFEDACNARIAGEIRLRGETSST